MDHCEGLQIIIIQIGQYTICLKVSLFLMKHVQFDSLDTAQISHYLKTRVLPILQPLQIDVLEQKPADIKSFAYLWLQSYRQNQDQHRQPNQEDDQQPEQVFKEKVRKNKQKEQGRSAFRVGVSGESTSSFNLQKQDLVEQNRKTYVRTEQTMAKILVELRNSILFKNMSHSSLLKLIQRMKPLQFKAGDVVIKQGEDGNELFIVDEGFFKCYVSQKVSQQKIYGPGQAFGELALLYNTKRASTIIAETNGRLYSLGRLDFNTILRGNIARKTEMCDRILENIQIFQTLDRYERSKVYEALQEIQLAPGKYIIREGQIGECFYIVAQGKLVAQKLEDDQLKPVYYYKEGDYFGELALIKNIVRQASIKTLTKECVQKASRINREHFKEELNQIQKFTKKTQKEKGFT